MAEKYPKDEDLTEEQIKLLERLVNEKHTYLGLRRMFDVVKTECEQSNVKHIYRDQLERWLKDQEWYQLHKQPPKRKDTRLTKGQPTYSRDIYTVESSTKPKGTMLRGYKVKDDAGNVKRGVYNKTELQVIQKVAPTKDQIKTVLEDPAFDLRRSSRLNEHRALTPRFG